MRIFKSLDRIPRSMTGGVLVMGNFDGLHVGHRALIRWTVREARRTDRKAICLTFSNHPVEILKGRAARRLMTPGERISGFRSLGLDGVIELPFTRRFAATEAPRFLAFVCGKLRPSAVCVGENFYFGAGGRGDTGLLERSSGSYGYRLKTFPVLTSSGKPVSSTLIRNLIGAGRVEEAGRLLGRPYAVSARVIRGEGQGSGLGYPTANFDPSATGTILPRDGVYETRTSIGTGNSRGRIRRSVTFIGPRFGSGQGAFETHIPGFRGNLYGRTLTVRFVGFLRRPRRFRTTGALIRSIQRDVRNIKEA